MAMFIQCVPSRYFHGLAAEDVGATTIEYAFIVSLVSIGIGFLIPEIRASMDEIFLQTASGLSAAAAP